MIKSQDRSKWFGASDVKHIMGNWATSTFMNWWQVKIGIKSNDIKTVPMIAGTNIEHRLAYNYAETHDVKITTDRQVRIRSLRLRVNLDCETKDGIQEIKTHKQTEGTWKMPVEYGWQVQVQMFATKKRKACIYAYALIDEDYDNFYLPIDNNRIDEIPIEYNEEWVNCEFLPRIKYLASCLKKKKTPNKKEFMEGRNNVST